MKTVHFFAFYPHNLPKNTFFAPRSSMNPKNTKSLHFDRDGWVCSAPLHFLGVQSIFFRCSFNPLQMCNQSFSNFNFRIFEFLLLLLWWFTPAFVMRWFNIDLIPMNIALILFLTLIAILPCREYKIFRPGKYLFPAEKILHSLRKSTTFLPKIKCILVKNEVHSRKEYSWFS